jgi:farnesyl-diphosphate farnesyltransferase
MTNPRAQSTYDADLAYQNRILPDVSRTFALTIPQLPKPLAEVVTNAYLLCRLADTIEDDTTMDGATKAECIAEFLAVVRARADAGEFAARLAPLLATDTPEAERELIRGAPIVLRITRTFTDNQQRAISHCVERMGQGMAEFQRHKTLDGLPSLIDLDRYCYFVAGIVGEMLTDLFCEYCPTLGPRRNEMMALAVCFGQGLQMTNILKDVWEDREANTCWLPQSVFCDLDGGLARAIEDRDSEAMVAGIGQLVGIAHAHLQSALRYTQLIPKNEPGIRRFCLWAIGMAVLTLRRIHENPGYAAGTEVKISRRAVKATIVACNVAQISNRATRALFTAASRGLPLAPRGELCPPPGAPLASDPVA